MMKVLIVDDSLINLKVAVKTVEKEGYEVDSATSGKECLEMVKNNKYDCILMDIMMPEMDGVETFKKLQEIEDFDTPVITLTADTEPGSKEKYLNLGFFDYIDKPVNSDKIKNVFSKL